MVIVTLLTFLFISEQIVEGYWEGGGGLFSHENHRYLICELATIPVWDIIIYTNQIKATYDR